MKLAVFALVLVLLPACRARSEESREAAQSPPEAAAKGEVLDFSAVHGETMTVEEFVKVCQEVSGFNFTYAESTREALRAKSLRLDGPERVPSAEFGSFLGARLEGSGFTCERIGPESVRMFLIKPRAS